MTTRRAFLTRMVALALAPLAARLAALVPAVEAVPVTQTIRYGNVHPGHEGYVRYGVAYFRSGDTVTSYDVAGLIAKQHEAAQRGEATT